MAQQTNHCLGSYVFLWGHKQEHTRTWFGMFLPTGERTAAIDAMTYAWTGRWPANRCPDISSLRIKKAGQETFIETPANRACSPGTRVETIVAAQDRDGDALEFRWELRSASSDKRSGGDAEQAPPAHAEAIIEADGPRLLLRTANKPGAYRVFVYVLDGKGTAATANVPILVK